MKEVFSRKIKDILKKLLVALMIVFTLQQIVPNRVNADNGGVVGKLTEPFVDLLLALGDGVVNIAHKYIVDQNLTKHVISYENGTWSILKFFADKIFAFGAGALAGFKVGALVRWRGNVNSRSNNGSFCWWGSSNDC